MDYLQKNEGWLPSGRKKQKNKNHIDYLLPRGDLSIHNINVGNPDDDINMEDFKAAKAIAPVEFDNVMKAKDRQHQKDR